MIDTDALRTHLQAALAALDGDGEPDAKLDVMELLSRNRGSVDPDDVAQRRKAHVRLTLKQAKQVHHMIAAGMRNADIAKRFGVSPGLISLIRNGRAWSHAAPKAVA